MKIKYPKFKGFIDAVQVRIPLLLGQYEMMENLEKEGTVLSYHPAGHWDVSHMEKDIEKIHALYDEGVREAEARLEELKTFLQG